MAKRKKRHLRKSIKIILICLCACIAGCIGKNIISGKKKEETVTVEETPQPVVSVQEEKEESKEPEVYTASMYMLGDLLYMLESVQDANNGDGTYDYAKQLDSITAPAKNYDLAFYNQEVILGGDHLGITIFPHLNAPQSLGDYMVSRGFNMVSGANNHALDKGSEGIDNSNAFWKAKDGVAFEGTYSSQEERDTLRIHETNGITWAFTAWTYGMNGNENPADRPYMVNCYRGHEQEMLDWVRNAKSRVDFVIVSIHWGEEFQETPNEEQVSLAQQLSDAGADLIIGNHAHNIQPVTWINDRTLCFYALGNCIGTQDIYEGVMTYEGTNTGMAAAITIEKTADAEGNSTTVIKDPKVDLLYTYDYGDFSKIEVYWYKDLTDEIFPGYREYYEQQIRDVVHAMDSSIAIGLE